MFYLTKFQVSNYVNRGNLNYQKRGQKYETTKIGVGKIETAFFRIRHLILSPKSRVGQHGVLVLLFRLALHSGQTRAHYLLPILARRTAKQQHERLRKHLKVVVAIDGTLRVELDVAEHLHTDDGVDEKEHGDEQAYVGQRLERLYERPEQDANRVALSQQFDETSRTKQTQKAQIDGCFFVQIVVRIVGVRVRSCCFRFDVTLQVANLGDDHVRDAADHRDKVEYVPRISKVVLNWLVELLILNFKAS